MGCFSFMCKRSYEPILSSSFDGDAVHLFLLEDGKVIEHMFGNYDSYGRVFGTTKDPKDTSMTDKTSFEWKLGWGNVCDLMLSKDRHNGISAILEPFWSEGEPYPNERSEDDPNQGWGRHINLLGSVSNNIAKKVKKPYHKVFNK